LDANIQPEFKSQPLRPAVDVKRLDDGAMILRSPYPVREVPIEPGCLAASLGRQIAASGFCRRTGSERRLARSDL